MLACYGKDCFRLLLPLPFVFNSQAEEAVEEVAVAAAEETVEE